MKKTLIVTLAGAAALLSLSANAQTWNFDFNDGLQGWTISGANGRWVNPAFEPNGPMLPDGAVSGAGAGNLYLPDGMSASFNLPAPTNKFRMEADVYVPNLRPLTGFPGSLPSNGINWAGIAANRASDGQDIGIWGRIDSTSGANGGRGLHFRDYCWDNTDRRLEGVFRQVLSVGTPDSAMYDKWLRLRVDYNLMIPGKVVAQAYIPWTFQNGAGTIQWTPGWYDLTPAGGVDVGAGGVPNTFQNFTLGQIVGRPTSWTQAQFDNVMITTVPEPGSVIALLTGVVGLAGVAIRRKRA